MIFDNWNISGCVKLRMLDNKTSSFDVVGNIPDGWEWKLLYSCNGNLNIVEMQHEENILSVIFTKEMLPTDGTYLFQLKATKDDLVKHTNIVKSYVNKSLSGDIKWPVIPTEFTQIEQVVKGYAESAKESSIKAENAAVHSPIVGENGNWLVWDFEKSEYVDSGKPASIGGGNDLSLGITGAQVGQIAKITAVDTNGKPTEWEAVDMAGGETWEKIADIALTADTAIYDVANFGVYRKVKILMSRERYVSGLNDNVWFRIIKSNDNANMHGISEVYMTVEYGYLTWEINAEFGSTFSYVSKNATNNRYSPDCARQTVAVPVGILDPNDYRLRILFQGGGTVIQDGDTVAVYGVKR